jgi:hypothetical protein
MLRSWSVDALGNRLPAPAVSRKQHPSESRPGGSAAAPRAVLKIAMRYSRAPRNVLCRQLGMQDTEFQAKMSQLIKDIRTLPDSERGRLEQLADETRARHEQIKTTMARLQDSLDQLRLSVKYIIFDLEATRRENLTLRKRLMRRSGGDAE